MNILTKEQIAIERANETMINQQEKAFQKCEDGIITQKEREEQIKKAGKAYQDALGMKGVI